MATLEQQIAQKQDELARLKEKARKLENGQKIIIGGMMLAMAKDNPTVSKKLLEWINQEVTRKTDLKRLENIIDELKETAQQSDNNTNQDRPIHQHPTFDTK